VKIDSSSLPSQGQPATVRSGNTETSSVGQFTLNGANLRIDSPQSESTAGQPSVEETVVEASRSWPALELNHVWRFRELMYELAWRDVQVQYKQTVLGAAWAVIRPTMMMVIFTFCIGRFAKFSTGDIPGPVFFYAGFLPWTLFSSGLSRTGNSVVGSVNLITKIYFPRLIVPFSALGPPIIDFTVAISMLGVLMMWYGIVPSVQILLAPLAVVVLMAASLAGGLFLAALNVSYRDFRHVIPFLVQIGMFATAAIFMDVSELTKPTNTNEVRAVATDVKANAATTTNAKSDPYAKIRVNPNATVKAASPATRWLIAANPMNGIIAFFRAATLGTPLPWASFGTSAGIVFVVLIAGLYYFRHVEDTFADVI